MPVAVIEPEKQVRKRIRIRDPLEIKQELGKCYVQAVVDI